MKNFDSYLFTEKYRPQTTGDMLLTKAMKSSFTKMKNDGEIPNMLLYSTSPGTGKTSLAKAICKEMEVDYLYINASSETGIDVLRSNVQKFATVKSIEGKNKIVIMDEFENASPSLQAGLKAFLEQYHSSCRFIFTCNNITKIIEPLKSRCQLIDFNLTEAKVVSEMKPKIVKRLKGILIFEKIECMEGIVEKIVDMYYPDMRRMLSLLQQYSNVNKTITNDIFDFEKIDEEFYDYLLNKQLTKARKYLIDKSYNYTTLFRTLFDNFVPRIPKEKQAQAILTIASYMNYHPSSIDPEINVCAMLLELIGNME